MSTLDFGAKQAVYNCARVKKGEKVVVITDHSRKKIADAIIKHINEAGGELKIFVMEDLGPRPEDGVNPLKFPEEVASAMSAADVSFFIAGGKPGELDSFRFPMLDVISKSKVRHGHMIFITEEIMEQGMATDYSKVQDITKKIYDVVSKAKNIHITTPVGSDVSFEISSKLTWEKDDGILMPRKLQNLPGGEIFTCPADANGVVVVEGGFSELSSTDKVDLSRTPISYQLKDGRCLREGLSCKNKRLLDKFIDYTFNSDENSNRVGELGIGTNIGLTKLIGHLLQDEKFPGAHIALGNPYPQYTGANWSSKVHNDGILLKTTIVVDGKTIMKDGKFVI